MDCTQPAICFMWKVLNGVFIAWIQWRPPYYCRCLAYPSYIITVSLEYLTMPLAFVPQCLGAHRSHCCVNDVKFPSLKYSFLLASLKPNTLTEVKNLSFIAARIKFKSLMLDYKVVSGWTPLYIWHMLPHDHCAPPVNDTWFSHLFI